MVRALEAVRYVPEVWYNLISIRVLGEEGCRIQVQQGVITVSQGDRVILEGENYGGLQAEGRKLSSMWSFKDKPGRNFIVRWSFKEDCNGT